MDVTADMRSDALSASMGLSQVPAKTDRLPSLR